MAASWSAIVNIATPMLVMVVGTSGLLMPRTLSQPPGSSRRRRGVEERRDHGQQPLCAVEEAVAGRDEVRRAGQHRELRRRHALEVAHDAAAQQPEELD